jgi:hypothetical protein
MRWMTAAVLVWVWVLFSVSVQAKQEYVFEDICYLSCEEAWSKSGQSVDNATEMIKVLGKFSLGKRSLTFPENEEMGRQLGELIKANCTTNPEDLLFNAVDKSLRRLLVKPNK